MVWLLALVPVSLLGVWLAARHWYGWAVSAASEVIWAAYALSLHSPSLLIMSGVWLVLHLRNTRRTWLDSKGASGVRRRKTACGTASDEGSTPSASTLNAQLYGSYHLRKQAERRMARVTRTP